MRKLILFGIFLVIVQNVGSTNHTIGSSWYLFTNEINKVLKLCLVNVESVSLKKCAHHGSLKLFDNLVSLDVIPIMKYAKLVKKSGTRLNASVDIEDQYKTVKKDLQSQMKSNFGITDQLSRETKQNEVNEFLGEYENVTWTEYVIRKLNDTVSTHSLQVDLGETMMAEPRHRHRHQNQMLPMMLFGVTAFGLVMFPMAFQFLSVLAGKAILLSKMALMLASINGLKRIANSGVHYGLYHSPDIPHYHHGFDRIDGPR